MYILYFPIQSVDWLSIFYQQDKSKSGLSIGSRFVKYHDLADDIVLNETFKQQTIYYKKSISDLMQRRSVYYSIVKKMQMSSLDEDINSQIEQTQIKNTDNLTYLGSKSSCSGASRVKR